MSASTFIDDLEELETAEEFLNYFAIPFDPQVVHVNRLHILQRFHDYLHTAADTMPDDEQQKRQVYAQSLQKAYQDFVASDARTEKVFKIFHKGEQPQETFVPLEDVFR
jgi:nitrogenase-stabilizing/protective protein